MPDIDQDILSLLAESVLFRDFPPAELQQIAARFKRETHHRGMTLYKKGDVGEKLFVISSGHVALTAPGPSNNQEVILAVLGRGEVFGEMSLLTGEPRTVNTRLESTSEFFVLEKKDFEELLTGNPAIGIYLSRILSRRLAQTTESSLKELAKRRITEPKLVLLLRLTSEAQGILFGLNLAVNLLEQTRRRVALIELCLENKSSLTDFAGLGDIMAGIESPGALSLQELLRKTRKTHASGLDLFTVPSSIFSSPRDKDKAFVALNWLRATYDFSILIATPLQWDSLKLVFEEVDQILFLNDIDMKPDPELKPKIADLIKQAGGNVVFQDITLVPDGRSSFVKLEHIRIGWARAIDRAFDQNKNPFEALMGTRTLRDVERMARVIADVKIGLALGSGGALGHTLIGMLRVLERERIYPDLIAGTSIGALVGAMYARGMSVEEMVQIALSINKNWLREIVFWDIDWPSRGGFMGGLKLQRFLRSLFDDLDFNDLELPFAAIATDIGTGEEVAIREGRVLDAVRSSIAMPVVFKPNRMGKRLLVDGGLVNPVPASTLVQMGADMIIAARLTNSPAERRFSIGLLGKEEGKAEENLGILDIFFRMILTMSHQIATGNTESAHVTIHPKTPNYNWTDFDKGAELIPLGEAAAEEALPKIKAQLPIFADYCTTRLR
ncbi:MAG: patatin-like phospholipase family protein [Elusimicrobia bacterium]|nr:patatin-like phospholipase family protein [Elusimicrobiota bacterium]